MSKILLDTDVIIEWLRGNKIITDKLLELRHHGNVLCHSPVNKAEIYHGLRKDEANKTMDFFNTTASIPVTDEIGEIAGNFLSSYHTTHSLELGDALIAATCYIYDIRLFTLNRKRYPMKNIVFQSK